MPDISYDSRGWKDLGVNERVKLSLASLLIISSIVLGFVSFIWLALIPTSVIATMGLFGSEALAILGIASYFNNEMIKFESKVRTRLDNLGQE